MLSSTFGNIVGALEVESKRDKTKLLRAATKRFYYIYLWR